MKFILIIHFCSMLTQTCPNMMNPQTTFDTWYECAIAGYEIAGKTFRNINKNVTNKQKLAIKFECKELQSS